MATFSAPIYTPFTTFSLVKLNSKRTSRLRNFSLVAITSVVVCALWHVTKITASMRDTGTQSAAKLTVSCGASVRWKMTM